MYTVAGQYLKWKKLLHPTLEFGTLQERELKTAFYCAFFEAMNLPMCEETENMTGKETKDLALMLHQEAGMWIKEDLKIRIAEANKNG